MQKSTLILYLCMLMLLPAILKSQENRIHKKVKEEKEKGAQFKEAAIFQELELSKKVSSGFRNAGEVSWLELRKKAVQSAERTMTLPIPLKKQKVQLELVEVPLSFYDYSIITSDGMRYSPSRNNRHYRGIIANDPTSVVAISFSEDDVFGIISNKDGNYNLAKDKASGQYVLYNEKNLVKSNPFTCGTKDDLPKPGMNIAKSFTGKWSHYLNCTSLYFETEFDIYQTLGSVANVESYVTAVYNQVALLYEQESIPTRISEIYVWTSADPYNGGNTSYNLQAFQLTRTSFNGDLGQLLTFRHIGGGEAAGVDGLCNTTTANRLSTSYIENNYQNIPVYSWTVYVIAHEFGHLFGSRHTHACVWNGNNTAIDGCAGYSEYGGCAVGPIPAGGTIMSYCHQNPAGINFNYGFGPQPGEVIRNKVLSCKGGIQMSGDPIVCSSKNYSLSGTPAGATITWSVYPSGLATVSGSGTSATLTRTGTDIGEVTLRATFTGGCPETGYYEKVIWVGEPERPTTIDMDEEPITVLQTCRGAAASVYATDNYKDYVTGYAWHKASGAFSMNTYGNMASVWHASPTFGFIDVKAQNECGYSLQSFVSVQIINCSESGLNVKTYPNPANQQIRITVEETKGVRSSAISGTAVLFNLQGQKLRTGTIRNGQTEFRTTDLPNGIYILQIQTPKKVIRQEVIIRHN